MSLFSNKKDTEFASGLFRNTKSGQKINTALHGPLTTPDLNKQGFTAFGSKPVNGGELFSQDIGGGKSYQEFVQRPKGWTPTGGGTPTQDPRTAPAFTSTQTPDSEKGWTSQKTPMTIDTPPEQKGGLDTPDFLGRLPDAEEKQRQEYLDQQIADLTSQSEAEIMQIRQTGKVRLGEAKGFLAKVGALGRTITGAPLETNLGVLGHQNKLIEDAIKEEQNNLKSAIASAKQGSQKAAQERVDALNELMQTNFENELKLIQDNREEDASDRADKLADLQIKRLNFDIDKANNDLRKENIEDTLTSIDRMAESGIPLDQLSLEMINGLETNANLPQGSFEAYYQAKQDAQNIASEENLLKLERAKVDIMNIIEDNQLARDKEEREAKQDAQRIAISGGNLSLAREKFNYEKTQDQGGPVDTLEQFANNYMANTGQSIDPNSAEVQSEYDNYVTWQKAQNLLKKYQDDPTSGYKDYVMAGGQAGTGKSYDQWYSEFHKTLQEILAEGMGLTGESKK